MTPDMSLLGCFGMLSEADINEYMRASGWRKRKEFGDIAVVWQTSRGGRKSFDIMVPVKKELVDYDERVWEFLSALEEIEGRRKFEILNDMAATGSDIIRIRAEAMSVVHGTLSINNGVDAVKHIRDMLVASACASMEKKPIFQGSRPSDVNSYIANTLLGPTEAGSYIFTVISPLLEAAADSSQYGMMEEANPVPFGRKVVVTLAKALSAAISAAEEATSKGSAEVFMKYIGSGISANLCDAIVGFARSGGGSMDVGVSWSRRMPGIQGVPNRVVVPRKYIDAIDEARRILRAKNTGSSAVIVGIVRKCKRNEDESIGQATIRGYLNNETKTVQVFLEDDRYNVAVDAHKFRKNVRCVGSLEKVPDGFIMRCVDKFDIIDEMF